MKIIEYICIALMIFICMAIACSCNVTDSAVDDQPEHIEVKVVGPDSVLQITIDSAGIVTDLKAEKDQVKVIENPLTKDSLLESIYLSQVGVREKTGHNDGVDVEKYLRSVGLPKGSAWCAAFLKWCFDQAGIKTTITAWSPTAHNPYNIVYYNGQDRKPIARGDVGTLYYPKLKRIGHTFFIKGRFGMGSVETVEGNTNQAGSREGDGVYVKIRPKSSIYSISRWF